MIVEELAPPPFLDDIGCKEWARIITIFAERGRLSDLKIPALQAYCAAYGRWYNAEMMVKEWGVVVKAPGSDRATPNPHMEISRVAQLQMRQYMNDLDMFQDGGEVDLPRSSDGNLETFFRDLAETKH